MKKMNLKEEHLSFSTHSPADTGHAHAHTCTLQLGSLARVSLPGPRVCAKRPVPLCRGQEFSKVSLAILHPLPLQPQESIQAGMAMRETWPQSQESLPCHRDSQATVSSKEAEVAGESEDDLPGSSRTPSAHGQEEQHPFQDIQLRHLKPPAAQLGEANSSPQVLGIPRASPAAGSWGHHHLTLSRWKLPLSHLTQIKK
ncbi:hypothetical protein P7K49_017119 [Saguinus oedipus]|uniref:Uncharacterized protein n=1 Tax=Saguinus oedipus TaxID=9490 RepID=A0ABQ9V1K4_SAGOE|nr:hypothetical protein P7K49_017119 [Saguinus oedipus]